MPVCPALPYRGGLLMVAPPRRSSSLNISQHFARGGGLGIKICTFAGVNYHVYIYTLPPIYFIYIGGGI